MSIVLYGATGFTGKLVATELARRDVGFTLAGRNAGKLAVLAAEHGVPWQAAAAGDTRALRDLLADASVVINCAGPFTLAGYALPTAAAETGTHYIDSTGEQTFMQRLFETLGPAAEKSGAALVPGMGFDYVPGDCIARIVCRDVEPVDSLVLAYQVEGFGMTRGTMRSALEMLGGDTVVYRDGRWSPEPRGIQRSWFDFPAPLGRQRMTRYPAGEVITVPRHTKVRNVTTMLTASTSIPDERAQALMTYTEPLIGAALRTPLRGLLNTAIGKLPEGPSEESRRGARFTICAVATGADGRVANGSVNGTDIYGLTAVALGWAAERMADPGYDRAGALGPAAAFDPVELLDSLAPAGLSYSGALAPA